MFRVLGGRHQRRILWACVALGALAIVLASASSVLAARGHAFERAFGAPCSASPCPAGELHEPSGVAVNEASGDVYVVDKGDNRVEYFSAAGVYRGQFDGSGTFEIEVGGVKKTETGTAAPTGKLSEPEGIAVDNACHVHEQSTGLPLTSTECNTLDPSNGDVYVVDRNQGVIDKFNAQGEYLTQLTEAEATPFSGLAGVATDPQGTLWVYELGVSFTHGVIDRFTNAASNVFTTRVPKQGEIEGLPGFGLPGFAVDSEDNFYVHYRNTDLVGRFAKVDSSGQLVVGEVDGEGSSGVAVEQSRDDVFVDNVTSVGVFGPAGGFLERLGLGVLVEGSGVGVDGALEVVYVADSQADVVDVFAPVPSSAPTVESESVSDISAGSATLGGVLNPRGAATRYHFEVGVCGGPSSCAASGYSESVPVPEGSLPGDFEDHVLASVHLQSLLAQTTYHFRLLASNAHGEGAGVERVFTTQTPARAAGFERGGLGDGRQWELVSPADKFGAAIEPISESGLVQAAAGGGAVSYLANAPTEAQPQGNSNEVQVLSTRGGSGWGSRDIASPHNAATGKPVGNGQEYRLFSEDLSAAVLQPFGEFVPGLSGEASEQTAYLRSLDPSCGSSCYRPLVTGKPGIANVEPAGVVFGEESNCKAGAGAFSNVLCGPQFVGGTGDLSDVVLRSAAALKAGAGGEQLYEWSSGALALISVLPNGMSAPESPLPRFGLADRATRRAVSSGGSRVVWEAGSTLYVRDVRRGETVEVAAGAQFQIASADGSRVFYTAAGGGGLPDLFECVIGEEAGKLACATTDLTPVLAGQPANVQGSVLGASTDGSWVYFVADGVQSTTANARGETALAGQPNLYVLHGGVVSLVAVLSPGDNHDWDTALEGMPVRVSGSGRWLAFMSQGSLTGYDNRDGATGAPVAEVYLYDGLAGRVVCASCDPTGARPVGVEYRKLEPGSGGVAGGPRGVWEASALVAANVPGWDAVAPGRAIYQSRFLSGEGRLFFDSGDGLVSGDVNGTEDVYEFEPVGVGGCSAGGGGGLLFVASSDGCVGLISSGSSAQESGFLDASENGNDVFFLTAARLAPGLDTDAAFDVYDAHVCSGSAPCFAEGAVVPPACGSGDSCKAAPSQQPDIFGAPASSTFSGVGNAPPVGVVKRVVKPLTRAQKLAKALKACRGKRGVKARRSCEALARRRYGPVHKAKKAKKAAAKSASGTRRGGVG